MSISAVQAASGNISGFQFGGQPFLWLEMFIAGILIVIEIIQVVKSLNPAEYISGGTMSGMIALAMIALLMLIGKYFLFDTQPPILGTNLLGNNITVPPISSFYGSGYWVYNVSLVITLEWSPNRRANSLALFFVPLLLKGLISLLVTKKRMNIIYA